MMEKPDILSTDAAINQGACGGCLCFYWLTPREMMQIAQTA
jgi:hypothetical protein